MVWFYEKPESAYLIRPRAGHTMTKISDTKFCVIGGSSGSDFFNDIHVYDIRMSYFFILFNQIILILISHRN